MKSRNLFHWVSNLPGWRTNRKIVVFESDDWGSIRMPSKEVFNALLEKGIRVDQDPYCKNDALESNYDLENLFEVLSVFKDVKNNHPVFTVVSLVANPDFEKIKTSDYKNYYCEPFTETLNKYPQHDKVYNLYKEGIERRLFVPQFHGREHLNVQRWLRDLQSGNQHTLMAFNLGLWGIYSSLIKTEYQAAFDIEYPSDNDYLHEVLSKGLTLFRELWNYKARFFVPTNGPFNLSLESTLHDEGIKYIMLDKLQKEPLGNGKFKTHIRYLGKKGQFGQIYLSRNAIFEPTEFPNKDNIDSCLSDIRLAFRMKKPATISTHRLNYIGWINPRNRDNSLIQLKELLRRILQNWPEVEFLTSDQLGDLIA